MPALERKDSALEVWAGEGDGGGYQLSVRHGFLVTNFNLSIIDSSKTLQNGSKKK